MWTADRLRRRKSGPGSRTYHGHCAGTGRFSFGRAESGALGKTAPTSSLCAALELPTAQTVSASLQAAPRAAANQDDTLAACNYVSADGNALLTLTPAMRSYDEELALARTLVRDPASSGMRDVRVMELAGIGQGAFSEIGFVLQQQQNIAHVVWRSGSRAWVLTLAETVRTADSARLGAVAKQISPRVPQ